MADFEAVRLLHATRARALVTGHWTVPNGENGSNEKQLFIEDSRLRDDHAELIGQIAESYHWSIEQVANNLLKLDGSGPQPIRAQLLACILRCADASQIDSKRTPTLHARLLDFNRDKTAATSKGYWDF